MYSLLSNYYMTKNGGYCKMGIEQLAGALSILPASQQNHFINYVAGSSFMDYVKYNSYCGEQLADKIRDLVREKESEKSTKEEVNSGNKLLSLLKKENFPLVDKIIEAVARTNYEISSDVVNNFKKDFKETTKNITLAKKYFFENDFGKAAFYTYKTGIKGLADPYKIIYAWVKSMQPISTGCSGEHG